MDQQVTANNISRIRQHLGNQKIVLIGGCFDILHLGHIQILQQAKNLGDRVVIFLESDQKVALKGSNRPIHDQKTRAQILLALRCVDYVVMLPYITEASDYDALVKELSPSVIITTEDDLHKHFKERSAQLVGAQLKLITKTKNTSTSDIVRQITD
jgi:FAD synthetase